MKLQFRCSRCGEVLGEYNGKDFYIVVNNKPRDFSRFTAKLLCVGCWNQTKSSVVRSTLRIKKEAKPKKIDVVEKMDKIERRESLEEGKKEVKKPRGEVEP